MSTFEHSIQKQLYDLIYPVLKQRKEVVDSLKTPHEKLVYLSKHKLELEAIFRNISLASFNNYTRTLNRSKHESSHNLHNSDAYYELPANIVLHHLHTTFPLRCRTRTQYDLSTEERTVESTAKVTLGHVRIGEGFWLLKEQQNKQQQEGEQQQNKLDEPKKWFNTEEVRINLKEEISINDEVCDLVTIPTMIREAQRKVYKTETRGSGSADRSYYWEYAISHTYAGSNQEGVDACKRMGMFTSDIEIEICSLDSYLCNAMVQYKISDERALKILCESLLLKIKQLMLENISCNKIQPA